MAAAEGVQILHDVDGEAIKAEFFNYLKDYVPEEDEDPESYDVKAFRDQVEHMKTYDSRTLFVDFTSLMEKDPELAEVIQAKFYRFEPFLRLAVLDYVHWVDSEFATSSDSPKEFHLSFCNLPVHLAVRELKTEKIGTMVAINGTVTRTSEVRPELLYGTFACSDCMATVEKVEQQFKFTEPAACPNEECGNRTKWELDIERSVFVDWQRVRVQENADEIPAGSMPRSVDVILRHGTVERAKAGDRCTFVGTLIVVPDVGQMYKAGVVPSRVRRESARGTGSAADGITGLRGLGVRRMGYKMAFVASSVTEEYLQSAKEASAEGVLDADKVSSRRSALRISEKEREHLVEMSRKPEIYNSLASSIAPTVYGHEEIKRGVLLMLLGGVAKTTDEGIRLRGDLNLCIVGDPSTAKSQFLKYAVKFSERSIYTSGKASSAAGLTASVAKDPDTGEFTIEAGALMLADNGICCIDEFEKMDPADQVAIHEAMEQQTISITKAGIQATLNARTSILAAANPVHGRYDKSKTLRHNVTISAPIMSRFDMFFVVLDEVDKSRDELIAKHIVEVHKEGRNAEPLLNVPYTMNEVQRYIKIAREINPEMTDAAAAEVVRCYGRLRQSDSVGFGNSAYRITVRQLESIIRLSEALARVHMSQKVKPKYVREAYRLLRNSIIRVDSGSFTLDAAHLGEDDLEDESVPSTPERAGRRRRIPDSPASSSDLSDVGSPARREKRTEAAANNTITYEEYMEMARGIVMAMRRSTTEENRGVFSREDVVAQYFDFKNIGLDDISALDRETRRVHQVVHHLVTRDHVLLAVSNGSSLKKQEVTVNPDFRVGYESVTTDMPSSAMARSGDDARAVVDDEPLSD